MDPMMLDVEYEVKMEYVMKWIHIFGSCDASFVPIFVKRRNRMRIVSSNSSTCWPPWWTQTMGKHQLLDGLLLVPIGDVHQSFSQSSKQNISLHEKKNHQKPSLSGLVPLKCSLFQSDRGRGGRARGIGMRKGPVTKKNVSGSN